MNNLIMTTAIQLCSHPEGLLVLIPTTIPSSPPKLTTFLTFIGINFLCIFFSIQGFITQVHSQILQLNLAHFEELCVNSLLTYKFLPHLSLFLKMHLLLCPVGFPHSLDSVACTLLVPFNTLFCLFILINQLRDPEAWSSSDSNLQLSL